MKMDGPKWKCTEFIRRTKQSLIKIDHSEWQVSRKRTEKSSDLFGKARDSASIAIEKLPSRWFAAISLLDVRRRRPAKRETRILC